MSRINGGFCLKLEDEPHRKKECLYNTLKSKQINQSPTAWGT